MQNEFVKPEAVAKYLCNDIYGFTMPQAIKFLETIAYSATLFRANIYLCPKCHEGLLKLGKKAEPPIKHMETDDPAHDPGGKVMLALCPKHQAQAITTENESKRKQALTTMKDSRTYKFVSNSLQDALKATEFLFSTDSKLQNIACCLISEKKWILWNRKMQNLGNFKIDEMQNVNISTAEYADSIK